MEKKKREEVKQNFEKKINKNKKKIAEFDTFSFLSSVKLKNRRFS